MDLGIHLIPHFLMHELFPDYLHCFILPPANETEGKKWSKEEDNIPNLPFVIVVPVALYQQFEGEMRRFIQPHKLDLLPYLQSNHTRLKWWENVYTQSKAEPGHRLIVTTPSVSFYF